ncbi:unnamed protein product [Ixodes pacificus]
MPSALRLPARGPGFSGNHGPGVQQADRAGCRPSHLPVQPTGQLAAAQGPVQVVHLLQRIQPQ